MLSEAQLPAPPWLDALNEITGPGGPFPSARSVLLGAATSSPAALRAALARYAARLGESGYPVLQRKADDLRQSISLTAPDPKVEVLCAMLTGSPASLVRSDHTATILYLRDRLFISAPAWCTKSQAGWGRIILPREGILTWFATGAPEVAPRVLITRSLAQESNLGRVVQLITYDFPEPRIAKSR